MASIALRIQVFDIELESRERSLNGKGDIAAARLRQRYLIYQAYRSPSYFVASVGGAPLETLKNYIQEGKSP